jgi:biopolymer transport protein ExbD
MGANLGTDRDKRSVNIELNIVPFIDLMSCLTAFLLVTAVWIDIARMDAKPRGKTVAGEVEVEVPQLSVLIEHDGIWVGQSMAGDGAMQHIVARGGDHDWDALRAALAAYKAGPVFVDRADLQLAAESTPERVVHYQALITAMDIAHQVGFVDVGLGDAKGLAARPVL